MIRQIIKIDSEKCNGCTLCVKACHEGAIEMQEGKAVLVKDDYCDGLGDCLPVCPTGAITFEKREALSYNEEAVKEKYEAKEKKLPCGCPSSSAKTIDRKSEKTAKIEFSDSNNTQKSELRQFPIQLDLVSSNSSFFDQSDLLVAADCTAFAYGAFHKDFMKGKITLIGCPKLDQSDYSIKLTEILVQNEINSLTVIRMEVPCCAGIVQAVKTALKNSGKIIPWNIVTISRDGNIIK